MTDTVHLGPLSDGAGEQRREVAPSMEGFRSAHRFEGKYGLVWTYKKIFPISETVRQEMPERLVWISAFPVA